MDNEASTFRVYLTLRFKGKKVAASPIIPWTLARLKEPVHPSGGGGLMAQTRSIKHGDVIIEISASNERLLEKAEELGFKKRCKDGSYREFCIKEIDDFVGGQDPATLVSDAEAIFLISDIVETLTPPRGTEYMPGFADLPVKSYYTLVHALKKHGFLEGINAVQDPEILHRFQFEMRRTSPASLDYNILKKETSDICGYFGHEIAFYFAFYRTYIQFLVFMLIFGLISFVMNMCKFDIGYFLCGALINVVLSSIFVEVWKRRSYRLAYEWGSLDFNVYERSRPRFYGDHLAVDPVTGEKVMAYPSWKRSIRQLIITYPLVVVYCIFSFFTALKYFNHSKHTERDADETGLIYTMLSIWPGIVHSAFTHAFDKSYRLFVQSLNNFENHKTNTDFRNALTTKLAIFQCVNCFLGPLFELFIDIDFGTVSKMLFSIFVVKLLNQKLNQTLIPYLTKKFKKLKADKDMDLIEKQTQMLVPYNAQHHQNYSNLFEQFGLVCMFSSIFPWVPLAALFYAIIDMKSDLFMILHVYQRPIPRLSQGIGPWLSAFEALSVASIAINLAIVALQPHVRKSFAQYSDVQYFLGFVAFEHALLMLRYAIGAAIRNEPSDVKAAVAKAVFTKNREKA